MNESSQNLVAGIILAVAFAVTGVATWAVAVQWNISSSLQALLSRDSRAAKSMNEMQRRVGSSTSLFAVVDSPSTRANLKFAEKYAHRLRKLPEVSLAHYHNDKTFFENHLLLYFERPTLEELRRKFERRLERARRRANPLFVPLDDEEGTSSGGKSAGGGRSLEDRIAEEADKFDHRQFKDYLISSDGYAVTIIVRFNSNSSNLVETNELLEKVKRVGQNLHPGEYHPRMKLQYGGGLVKRKAQYSSIVQDIRVSGIFTVVGIFLLIALYFRRLRAVGFVLVPLLMGALWALAVAFTVFGQLTTISVFIFAILLGLGIDYAVHLLSSFDERIANGSGPLVALRSAFRKTGRATTIGAATTLTTFFILAFSGSRGLSEFGIVAGMGVMFTLVAMFVVLPAMIVVWDRSERIGSPEFFLSSGSGPSRLHAPRWLKRRGFPLAVAIAALGTLASIGAITQIEFEENIHKIGDLHPIWEAESNGSAGGGNDQPNPRRQARRAARSTAKAMADRAASVRKSVEPDSFRPKREQKTVGEKYTSATNEQMSSTPTVLLFDSREAARRVHHYFERRLESGKFDRIQSVNSIYAFLPGTHAEQRRRLDEIVRIRELYRRQDLSVLDRDLREVLERFEGSLDIDSTVDIYDLPAWTKRLFRENGPGAKSAADGEKFAFEYVVYVTSKVGLNVGEKARHFLRELRSAREATGEDFQIASPASIYVATLRQLRAEGSRLVLLALLVIVISLITVFSSVSRGLVASLPLTFGLLWMVGIAHVVGIRFDMFNVVIIPAIIGLGVDDGVHFYTRYLEHGRGSLWKTFQTVGSTVVMTSLTSMVGFGGLTLADYHGVRSIGHLALAGISATLLATLIVLPAVLVLAEAYDWETVLPNEE